MGQFPIFAFSDLGATSPVRLRNVQVSQDACSRLHSDVARGLRADSWMLGLRRDGVTWTYNALFVEVPLGRVEKRVLDDYSRATPKGRSMAVNACDSGGDPTLPATWRLLVTDASPTRVWSAFKAQAAGYYLRLEPSKSASSRVLVINAPSPAPACQTRATTLIERACRSPS